MSWVRFTISKQEQRWLTQLLGFVLLGNILGCDSRPQAALVVATTWSLEQRSALETIVQSLTEDRRPIEWVRLEIGESLLEVVDRRGGVDLIIGVPSWEFAKLAKLGRLLPLETDSPIPWRLIRRTDTPAVSSRNWASPGSRSELLIEVNSTLRAEGWVQAYEKAVRNLASFSPPTTDEIGKGPERWDGIAIVLGGRNLDRSFSLIRALEEKGIVKRPNPEARTLAMADSLLDDLLRSAFVEAARELRDAGLALAHYNHPARAEASLAERPPWPPASVAKLFENSSGESLVETLLEQIAPDLAAREWLRESWSEPKRTIDDKLLVEIAGAADGRLINEPRFRAWLRGEWTAWSRQLYRRVARLAGGYVPS